MDHDPSTAATREAPAPHKWGARAAYLWPLAVAVVPAAVVVVLRWRLQHGAPAADDALLWWQAAFGFCVVGWVYALIAAWLLRFTPLRRPVRLAVAYLFPPLLWAGLSQTEGKGFLQFNHADVFFLAPAMLLSGVIPNPQFTSACAGSFWALHTRGFGASVAAMYELSDGSVLVAGRASRRETLDRTFPKLARLTVDGRPDTAFALGRGCVEGDVMLGPGGTFSVGWEALPEQPGRMALRAAWHDALGRPLARAPFPAPPGAVPPWAREVWGRPTPDGGFTFAGAIPASAAADTAANTTGDSAMYGVVRVLADGRYDPRFAPFPLPPSDGSPQVVAVADQADGALVVLIGYTTRDSARVVRLGPDGRPDTAFADRARLALAPYAEPAAIAVDAAGRVLVGLKAGSAYSSRAAVHARYAQGVVRLLADGRLDPAFLADTVRGTPRQLIPQPSGHLVVEYEQEPYGRAGQAVGRLVRFDPAGRLDPQFTRRLASVLVGGYGPVLGRRDGSLVVAVPGERVPVVVAPDGTPRRLGPPTVRAAGR